MGAITIIDETWCRKGSPANVVNSTVSRIFYPIYCQCKCRRYVHVCSALALLYDPRIYLNMVLAKNGINQCLGLQTEEVYAQLGRLRGVVSQFYFFALLVPVDHRVRLLFSEHCAVPSMLMTYQLAICRAGKGKTTQ